MPYLEVDLHQIRYFPGDTIHGNVICTFDKDEETPPSSVILTSDIKGQFIGEERTYWIKNERYTQNDGVDMAQPEAVEYCGYNRFLTTIMTIEDASFRSGRYAYKFTCQLPSTIPGSYSDTENVIKYYAQFDLSRPEGITVTKIKEIVVVASVVLSDAQLPKIVSPLPHLTQKLNISKGYYYIQKYEETTLDNPPTMCVSLDKNNFILGEVMQIDVDMMQAATKVDMLVAELGMEVEMTVLQPHKKIRTEYTLLGKVERHYESCEDNKKCSLFLKVPRNASIPNFSSCTLFQLSSFVKVTAKTPDSNETTVVVPVTLGHTTSSLQRLSRNVNQGTKDNDIEQTVPVHETVVCTQPTRSTNPGPGGLETQPQTPFLPPEPLPTADSGRKTVPDTPIIIYDSYGDCLGCCHLVANCCCNGQHHHHHHHGGNGDGDGSCDCGDGCCDCGDDCCDCGDGCGDCDCGDCGGCDCGDCGGCDCGDCGDCVIL